ncbi:hypothetical protein V8F06_014841 [Rhypophila decipiens]
MAPQTVSGPLSFKPFPRLPAELRLDIWDFVVNVPRVIKLQYHNSELVKVSLPYGFQLACRESYAVYKKHNHSLFVFYETCWEEEHLNGRVYAAQKKGKQHSFPVNFDTDFFLITGKPSTHIAPNQTIHHQHPKGLEVLYKQRQPFYKQVKKVILPEAKTPSKLILDLIDPSSKTALTNLEEVWLLVRGNGDGFCPEPAASFQDHCPLHHHTEFPSKYSRLGTGGLWDDKKKLCPACDWENSRWDNITQQALRPSITQRGNFRLTYDASLPKYPRLCDLWHSKIPVLRYIRRRREFKASTNLDHINEPGPSTITCLTSPVPITCCH